MCEKGRCGHANEYLFSHNSRVFTGLVPTERAARSAMVTATAKAGELLTKREKVADARAAVTPAEQQVRLGEYLDHWLERRGMIKPAIRRGYTDIVANHVSRASVSCLLST